MPIESYSQFRAGVSKEYCTIRGLFEFVNRTCTLMLNCCGKSGFWPDNGNNFLLLKCVDLLYVNFRHHH
jgi:hypothetical protein